MAGSIYDEAPTPDEIQKAATTRPAAPARPVQQKPKPAADIFDEAPTPDEVIWAKSGGTTRLTPEQGLALARQQGFIDQEGRGAESAFSRGMTRAVEMLPALPAELAVGIGRGIHWTEGQIRHMIDPSVPATKWSQLSSTEETPYFRKFGAKSVYENLVGPDALNIYPHRRPDETTAERLAGDLGELVPSAVISRGLMRAPAPGARGPVMLPRGQPYQTVAQTTARLRSADRLAAAEYGGSAAGGEIGRQVDIANGGDGSTGKVVGTIAGGMAPTGVNAAGATTKFVLRGGERGRQAVANAIGASDRLADIAGDTYRPTTTQRVLDAAGGGSGRPVNLTAGQAAPNAGLARFVERVASYLPGGYTVLKDKVAAQLENAGRTVRDIAQRAVNRFNNQARAENASRVPSLNYQMATTGQGARNALEEPIPTISGLTDEVAGTAIDRGLRERVAMNDNLRRMAEAEFTNLMPHDTPITMNNTIQALEALEVRLPGSPSVSQGTLRSPVIGNLRNELIDDATTVPGTQQVTIPFVTLRRVRERIGQFLDGDTNALGPNRMPERDARALYAALTEDMAAAARTAGPEAWLAWQTSQAVTRTGAEVASGYRGTLSRQTMEGIENAIASGEGSRVRDFMAAMPARDRDLVVANIFRKWGEASPGVQDAAGTAWSFDRWLTNANKAREKGALEALTTTSHREMADAIDALNTMATRVRARSNYMPNPSGSGRVMLTGGAVLAGGAAVVSAPVTAAAIAATAFVAPWAMARLMTNPRFIRWLARTDSLPPNAIAGHILRLNSLASNPDTAAAVDQYTQALMSEFENGDALDRAAMLDPTPVSESARQLREYWQGRKQPTSSNLLASAGAIGLATIGLGAAEGGMLKSALKAGEGAVGKDAAEAAARAGGRGSFDATQQTPNEVYGDGISDAASSIKYDDQGHWADLEGALQRTRQAESEHTIGAERTQRQTASTKVRPGDQAAIDKALRAARLVTDTTVKNEAGENVVKTTFARGAKAVENQIKAAIREVRDRFPEADGWQAITPSKIAIKRDRNGATQIVIEEWKAADGYNLTGGFRKGTPEYQKRVLKAADKGVQAVLDVLARAAAGDKAAQTIIRQMGWYREFTKKGFDTYGGSMPMVRDMLGASSPNTPVWMNYVFSQKGARALSQGEFDDSMRALADDMTGNTGPNAIPDAIKIRQPTGSLFGMNSGNMMNAIRERWLSKEPGQAPKARQFSENLGGLNLRATIDVWAARFTNRMVGGKRVPIPAEAGVAGSLDAKGMFSTGDFGFGQAVFANMAARLNKSGALKSELKKLGYNHITPADLQALTWFIEKEHWTKNNWTSAAGEGGSFEQMMDLDPLVRHQAGFSIQRDAPPSDADVMQARNALERALSSEKDVRMFRAHPTRGQYGQDVERSFDLEVVAKPGWDQTEYRRKVVQMAKDNGQKDVFFSRRLSPSEAATNPNARPGVEIYTRGRLTPAEMDGIMQQFREAGIDGFTFVTEHRKAERLMGGSDPATYHGLRLQVIPEFEMMFDDAARASFAKDPAALDKYLDSKLEKMMDVINGLQRNPRIVDARTHHYDTEVIHQTEYDDFLAGGNAWGGAGANEAGAGEAGGQGAVGRSRYENAARRDRALGKR